MNAELLSAARGHAKDMADHNFQGHVGSDNSTLDVRLSRVGYDYYLAGENVYAYAYSIGYAQAAFLVDWGVPELGHRKNLLDLGDHTSFREIGVGIVAESLSSTKVGPLVISQEFGHSNPEVVFITGVVYRDANKNKFYDPNEGLSGVTITPDHGEYYAVSSSSGGFAIPAAVGSGSYTLTCVRSDLPMLNASVNVGQENVKVDFMLGDPNYASIVGKIVDAETLRPMSGISVLLEPVGATMTTGIDGSFIFADLPITYYKIIASKENYEFSPNRFVVSVSAGQTYQTTIQAIEASSSSDNSSIPPAGDSQTSTDAIGGCGSMGIMVVMTIAMGFAFISQSRARNE
jgi:hypothetical protein